MSRDANKLLKITCNYEKIGITSLIIEAKKKEKKKLDPKAKVRNRGTVCVPASSAKDKKDHFPINDEGQARNALARVHQYSSVPSWYGGSLKSLQSLVSGKVHSKYPSIGKSDKKKNSSLDVSEELLNKYAQTTPWSAPGTQSGLWGEPAAGQPDMSGTGIRQPAEPQKAASDPKVRQLQTILRFTYKLTGKDGKPLAVDGVIGPNTQFALQSYKTEYGMPQATDAIAMQRVLDTASEGRAPGGYAGDAPAASSGQSPEMNAAGDVISKATAFLQALPAQFQMGRPKNLNQIYLQLQQMGGQLAAALPSLQFNPQQLGQAQQVSQQIGQWLTQIAGQARTAGQHNRRPQQRRPAAPATDSALDKLIAKYGQS
jgi:hypothetical protein